MPITASENPSVGPSRSGGMAYNTLLSSNFIGIGLYPLKLGIRLALATHR